MTGLRRGPEPVERYLRPQKRFRHLFEPVRDQAAIDRIQAIADANIAEYGLASKEES
ncbi:hypothetical protein GCM10029992_50130 [Glycomyces albus]